MCPGDSDVNELDHALAYRALRDIEPEEELTIDYRRVHLLTL